MAPYRFRARLAARLSPIALRDILYVLLCRRLLLPLAPETVVEIRAVARHRVERVPLARTLALPSYVLAEFAVGHGAFVVLDAPTTKGVTTI